MSEQYEGDEGASERNDDGLEEDEYAVAGVDELDDDDRIVVQLRGREIGVFNVDGAFYAYTNWCAHQGGPCCEGSVTGTREASYDRETRKTTLEWTRDGEILNCPWHGWEYDVTTGECLSKNRVRLPEHDVEVRGGDLVVSL